METSDVSFSGQGQMAAAGAKDGGDAAVADDSVRRVTLIAKFGKERIALEGLFETLTIGDVKEMLTERTGVLSKRQKLLGLTRKDGKPLTDDDNLASIKVKGGKKASTSETVHQFILMGTPEDKIFVDPCDKDDLPDVIDDFDLDFNAGSHEWLQHVANGVNLKKFTESTMIHVMNEPRPDKPLLVLDLDHTLLDFSSKILQNVSEEVGGRILAASMKRPHMDEFLTTVYRHYDLVVWSQTSWRWLETKLTELGMLTHPGYKFCFVLDKTSMFAIKSTKRDGTIFTHHVKPLQIIWSKFPRWGSHNTVHLDDLSRNFALNLSAGLKVSAFYRKKKTARRDVVLLGLGRYLEELALSGMNFDEVDFNQWEDVANGERSLRR